LYPTQRRRLLATIFDRVWQDGGTIVAVKPREAFLRYFQNSRRTGSSPRRKRGVKAGATGGSIPGFTPHEIGIR
jgi:hypothetical protein